MTSDPHERAEEADPASARTSWSDFRPAYASFPTITPLSNEVRGRGSGIPFLPAARRRTVSIASRRGGERFNVAMGTDEKRRPGLFETIIRRSIPLVVARCVSPLFLTNDAQRLANRLLG